MSAMVPIQSPSAEIQLPHQEVAEPRAAHQGAEAHGASGEGSLSNRSRCRYDATPAPPGAR